ncbi:chloride channel protein [Vulgatibacter incomptus]|uniref:Chloride channel protein n=1 Tax=Vulgatibacter incomptus TaxID=1391653 RepID=A0A0K1PA58_9BACT|nr:chloride channel protein [Vulgatibacter incomptus]AKU90296.1 Chloride channel protein [Vulgatibacter incomptus]
MDSGVRRFTTQLNDWLLGRNRRIFSALLADDAPVDLRLVGRTLAHAALVGLAAGAAGAAFLWALEQAQRLFLEGWAGYVPLLAHGEAHDAAPSWSRFRPWVLLFLPALGGLVAGWLSRFAPEILGGGGDAAIDAFHHGGGRIRRRVLWLKPLATLFTLGTGGSGGREGPTMQLGGAFGSLVADVLKVSVRERRILFLAGIAAGISAVFRTPLGAALIAVELLYRDGFESDALVPSVLASVVAYSVVTSIFGEATLFHHARSFPFIPRHLVLYGLLALSCSLLAVLFLSALRVARRTVARLPLPRWLHPAVGGLALGALITPVIVLSGRYVPAQGQGFGILGGGYGAVQVAISGASWLTEGWTAVLLLAVMTLGKLVATSLTIGSGGSAGDFAPSLAIGGLFGGAFGRAAQLLLGDPSIDPGAFALVGMGAFYGGIAHVPLSAMVLVCELAGNYDLLVPLMLTQGIAFVALRRHALYGSQPATERDSPVHRENALLSALESIQVREAMTFGLNHVFAPSTPASEILRIHGEADSQNVFPVQGSDGALVGMINTDAVRVLAGEPGSFGWAVAADVMGPFVSVRPDDDLRTAAERLVANGLRELPVVDDAGRIVGYLDEARISETSLGLRAPKQAAPGVAPMAPLPKSH